MKVLVFDIGGTAIKHGICIDDKLTSVHETATQASLGGRHIMDTLISLIREETEYDAIGISTAGQVNPDTGSIIYANNNIPGYTGTQIKTELESLFHVPVAVENDVNAAALGEAIYGAGKNTSDFLCLTYGTGVGGAIIRDKAVYHGCSFSAAEFGAIVTHAPEKIVGTDFYDGCYERYASATALVRKASTYDPSLDSGRKIFAHIHNPNVRDIVEQWADEVMMGLSTLIHIFNPSKVILGGGIMAQPLVMELIQARVPKYIMPNFRKAQIMNAALGNTAGLMGANHIAAKLLNAKS